MGRTMMAVAAILGIATSTMKISPLAFAHGGSFGGRNLGGFRSGHFGSFGGHFASPFDGGIRHRFGFGALDGFGYGGCYVLTESGFVWICY